MKIQDFLHSKQGYWLLLPILLLALYLRINHQWLIPYFYNADEYYVVQPSLHIFLTGILDPRVFKYGSCIYYTTALLYWIYFHLYSAFYALSFTNLIHQINDASPILYTIARYESAFFDLLNILMTYVIGKRLFQHQSVALVAALMTALNPLNIYMSHMAKVDTALTFFVLLVFYFSLRIQENGRLSDMILAGISAGLAMATKYDLIALLPPVVAAYFYARHHRTPLSGRTLLFVMTAFLFFFLVSPYTVLDIRGFLMDISSESAQQGLSLATLGWVHTRFVYQFLVQLPFCLSISVYLLFIAGLFRFKTFMNNEAFVLFLSYPFSYFVFSTALSASISQIIFSHLYLTIVPFIIILSSCAGVFFISKIKIRFLKYVIAGILLADVIIASSNFKDILLPYKTAGEWMESLTPSQIVRVSYVSPFNLYLGGNYEIEGIQPSPLMLKQISAFKPQVMLVSEGWYKTYFYKRESYYHEPIDTILSDMGYAMIKQFQPSSVYVDLFEHIDRAIDIGTIRIFTKYPG